MPTKTLTDEQALEVLGLTKHSDTVELKLTIAESEQRSALQALEIDPLEAQIRQVFFLDTPDLMLNQAGVVVRARRVQNKGDDSVVKLRPVDPQALPKEFRTLAVVRGRGRRDARRLRVLGLDEACAAAPGGQGGDGRRPAGTQTVQQGAARVLRRVRARRASRSTT